MGAPQHARVFAQPSPTGDTAGIRSFALEAGIPCFFGLIGQKSIAGESHADLKHERRQVDRPSPRQIVVMMGVEEY